MYRLVRSQVCYVLFVPTCIVSVKSLRRDLRKQICVFLLPGVNRINGIVLMFLTFDRKERTWRHLRRSIALAIRRDVKIWRNLHCRNHHRERNELKAAASTAFLRRTGSLIIKREIRRHRYGSNHFPHYEKLAGPTTRFLHNDYSLSTG